MTGPKGASQACFFTQLTTSRHTKLSPRALWFVPRTSVVPGCLVVALFFFLSFRTNGIGGRPSFVLHFRLHQRPFATALPPRLLLLPLFLLRFFSVVAVASPSPTFSRWTDCVQHLSLGFPIHHDLRTDLHPRTVIGQGLTLSDGRILDVGGRYSSLGVWPITIHVHPYGCLITTVTSPLHWWTPRVCLLRDKWASHGGH